MQQQQQQQATLQKYPRTGKRGAPQAFARKLYEIMDNEDPNVIGWTSSGTSFVIRDLSEFISTVLLKYFKHQKFSSFQRQLNLYGFRKIHLGPDDGGYSHPNFQAGHPELLGLIRRTPQSSATRSRSSRARSGSYVSAHDDDDEDYEDVQEQEQQIPHSGPRSSASSCISTIANCFATSNTASAPPPSYEAVMKADAQFNSSVHNEIVRDSGKGSASLLCEVSAPIEEASNHYFSSLNQKNHSAFSGPTYQTVIEDQNFFYQPVKLEPYTVEHPIPVVDQCVDAEVYNSMGSFGSFDINDEVCMELETQLATDNSLCMPETQFVFSPREYSGVEGCGLQPSDTGVDRPNLCRMFSTQSQEWDMNMDSNSLLGDEDIDFDRILQELTLPSSTTLSYSNYPYQNSQHSRRMPEATPMVIHQPPYPMALAQVMPNSNIGNRRYNTRSKPGSFYTR